MPAIPPTVSRTMPVSLLVAAGEARTGAPPGADLRTHGAVTTRAQTLCPGFQFTAVGFTSRLATAGVAISMDGRGRCLDNVFVERL